MGRWWPAAILLLAPYSIWGQTQPNSRSRQAVDDLERLKSGLADQSKSRFRLDPQTQQLKSASGLRAKGALGRDPRDVAVDFVIENRRLFFNPPESARTFAPAAFGPAASDYLSGRLSYQLERDHPDPGQRDILLRERYNGIPVEFSRVSVHLSPANEVRASFSSLDSGVVGVSPVPRVTERAALQVVAEKWAKGRAVAADGELVYLPKRFEEGITKDRIGKTRLAWKFHFRWSDPLGIWNVYVDAHTGELVGAVNELRTAAMVRAFSRDPNEGGNGVLAPVRGLVVTQNNATTGARISIPTDVNGEFNTNGGYLAAESVFAVFVTTYAAVINDKGANPIFAEGASSWQTLSVSSSSVSPYPADSKLIQSYQCPSNAVFSRVRFNQFDVGYHAFGEALESGGSQDDGDFVEILQPGNQRRLATYSGQNRAAFTTTITTGAQVDVRLVSNKTNGAGNEAGYKVNQIQCLVPSGNVAGTPDIRFFDTDGVLTYNGVGNDYAMAMVMDSLGRLVVVGYSEASAQGENMAVWRYSADGILDTSFGTNGVFTHHNAAAGAGDDRGNAVAIDSQGRIVVAGQSQNGTPNWDLAVWRLSSSGSLDTTFGTNGVFTHHNAAAGASHDRGLGVAIDSSGRIVVSGESYRSATNADLAVWRLTTAGALDTTFDSDGFLTQNSAASGNGNDSASGIAIDSTGRIWAAGSSFNSANTTSLAVWLVNSTGGVHGLYTEGSASVAAKRGQALAIDSENRIVVAGYTTGSGGNIDMAVWRLTSGVALDTSFATSGIYTDSRTGVDVASAVVVDQLDNIYVAGSLTGGTQDMAVWKLNKNGALDTAFGSSGIVSHDSAAGGGDVDGARAIILDSLANLAIAGFSTRSSNNLDLALWKITSKGTVDVVASNALKHLDDIHLYFTSGSPRYDQALSTRPALVHVNFGTDLVNAFYDPEADALLFGEGGEDNGDRNTALATDIIFHEYTHMVVDHIYNIANFGHDGALSEALSDFFALDALAAIYPSSAKSTFGEWAFPTASRQLNQSSKAKYPDNWAGEIHDDSLIVSGALWDLRVALEVTPQAKGLVKKLLRDSLFYFPDSFESLYEAMIATSAGTYDAAITQHFNNHGIGSWAISGADSYEPNDGFATAQALSSTSSVKATVYPGGDVDYYRFAAGAGPVKISLTRPLDTITPSYLYFAYGFQVFDINRQVLAEAMPPSVVELPASNNPGKNNSFVGEASVSATISLAAPKLLYVAVSAPLATGSNDFTNSTLSYELFANYAKPSGAITAGPVSAAFADRRTLTFSAVDLTGFKVSQATEAVVDHVDVLDHNLIKLTEASGSALTVTPALQLPGKLEGTVALPVNFFTRYPAIGSVTLEVFARNSLGNTYSLGLSNSVKVVTDADKLTAYNNIFDPTKSQKATLQYSGTASGHYRLAIYTANGSLVKILVDRAENAGLASVDWDGRNGSGEMVASGVYLAHLEGPGLNQTQKIVVVK